MENKEKQAAAEQRNCRQKKPGQNVARPARIPFQRQITPAPHTTRAQQRPEQNDNADQQRAMEKSFKIESGKKSKRTERREPLSTPV